MKPTTLSSQEATPTPNLQYRWEVVTIILALVVVAGGGFFAGFLAAGGVSASPLQQTTPAEFDVFWEVWNYVNDEYYYETPSDADRTYGAIRGMLATLDDPYTAFVQPSIAEYERGNVEGVFGGIGSYVSMNEFGQLVIVYPFPGQPAYEAGLLNGDVVLSVNGQSLEGLTLAEGTALIRGPVGTTIVLEIYRAETDELFEVEVERAQIEVPTVVSQMLEDNVAYVALYRFNGVATIQLETEIETLLAEEPRALIFDLRGNPGGLLDEAVSVSDLFLTEGLVATQRTSISNDTRVFYADNGDIVEDIPLVVLIDGGSASAAEIVAGAIRDRERGVLIGTTTFGKGSVQLVHDLSDGSQLRITYGAWYTPEEMDLNDSGITPDIEVELPEAGESVEEDLWIQAALAYINENFPE